MEKDTGDFSKSEYILLGIGAIILGAVITFYSGALASFTQPGYVIGNGVMFVVSYLVGPLVIIMGLMALHSGSKK